MAHTRSKFTIFNQTPFCIQPSPRAPNLSPPLSRTLGPWMLRIGRGAEFQDVFWLESGAGRERLTRNGCGDRGSHPSCISVFYLFLPNWPAPFRAGGVFDYATRGLNRDMGFIAGAAQLIEFLFAPPAICRGDPETYFHLLFTPGTRNHYRRRGLPFYCPEYLWCQGRCRLGCTVTLLAVFELLLFSSTSRSRIFPGRTCSTMRVERVDGSLGGRAFRYLVLSQARRGSECGD